MVDKKTLINVIIDGKPCSGQEISFEPIIEPWCKYRLDDGTIIRAKLNVLKVLRGVNEIGEQMFSENGEPVYIINHRIDLITSNVE